MSNPHMPNIPGAAVMTDTLDFVKSLWGSMGVPGIGIPGITAPTLSVDELDKKISELKAVESWLNLNATMLRSSIQALEVQRGTIAALKSMGQSLAAAVQQPTGSDPFAAMAKPKEDKPAAAPAAEAPQPKPASDSASAAAGQMANPAAWWNMLQEQFAQAVSTAMAADPTAKPAASDSAAPDAGKAAAAPPARKPAAKRAPKAPKS